jgi:hypothetical protein
MMMIMMMMMMITIIIIIMKYSIHIAVNQSMKYYVSAVLYI